MNAIDICVQKDSHRRDVLGAISKDAEHSFRVFLLINAPLLCKKVYRADENYTVVLNLFIAPLPVHARGKIEVAARAVCAVANSVPNC